MCPVDLASGTDLEQGRGIEVRCSDAMSFDSVTVVSSAASPSGKSMRAAKVAGVAAAMGLLLCVGLLLITEDAPSQGQGSAVGRVQLAGHKLLGGKVVHQMLQSSGAAANQGPPPHTDWVVSPYTYIHHEAGDGSPHQHWRYRTEYKRSAEDETRERWEWSPGGFVLNWQGEGAPPSGVVGTIKAQKNESMAVTSEGSSEEKWTGQDTWEWHHYTWRLFRKFQGNKMWVERYEWYNDTGVSGGWNAGKWSEPRSFEYFDLEDRFPADYGVWGTNEPGAWKGEDGGHPGRALQTKPDAAPKPVQVPKKDSDVVQVNLEVPNGAEREWTLLLIVVLTSVAVCVFCGHTDSRRSKDVY